MTHLRTLAKEFPTARVVDSYLDHVLSLTAELDFTPQNTFAAISVCRDELTQRFVGKVTDRWGLPFSLGGLGALPSLGPTGWRAALAHVPSDNGRGRLLIFGLPHIGIDANGVVGQSIRRQQVEATPTCGAMASLFTELHAPDEPYPTEIDDLEAERLRSVINHQAVDLPQDLIALTKIATQAVEDEMWRQIHALRAVENMDVAVFCGIQIHLPGEPDFIWPGSATYMGESGQRSTIDF